MGLKIMIKIVSINYYALGSTGKIMRGISSKAQENGFNSYCFCANIPENRKIGIDRNFLIGFRINRYINSIISRLSGKSGTYSVLTTLIFIKKLNKIKPNIIHLHNLHANFLNLPMLLRYINKKSIKVVWTFHDCWPFTGRCPHFQISKCTNWIGGCHECPYPKNSYPFSYVDNTKRMWCLKKKWFTSIKNMAIVTPSNWLKELIKESFLKDYPIEVIHNGIDLNVFKPIVSDFREKYKISKTKYVILGVSFSWGNRKGLDVFIELSKRLSNQYQIVLVGTNVSIDKELPKKIISIHRTNNQQELSEIYSAADLFVNPTREENYPTVNMESLACGTPVLTFKTGGSPEIIDETCGCVVNCDDIDSLEQEVIRICKTKPYSKDACLQRAKSFDMNDRFQEYINLYNK